MIAIDTNVLARFLLRDEPGQYARARRIVEHGVRGEGVFISVVVLCELVWVLRSAAKEPKDRVIATLDGLLGSDGVEIQERELVTQALQHYRAGAGDFSDYVIGSAAMQAGCTTVYTFDRKLVREEYFAAP
jgi:predicted nucleic-acid-binding protein